MNRKWNILNWNVRGINSQSRWDDLKDKLRKAIVVLYACKKQKEMTLTKIISEISLLEDLINMLIPLHWACLVG